MLSKETNSPTAGLHHALLSFKSRALRLHPSSVEEHLLYPPIPFYCHFSLISVFTMNFPSVHPQSSKHSCHPTNQACQRSKYTSQAGRQHSDPLSSPLLSSLLLLLLLLLLPFLLLFLFLCLQIQFSSVITSFAAD